MFLKELPTALWAIPALILSFYLSQKGCKRGETCFPCRSFLFAKGGSASAALRGFVQQ